MQKSCEFQWFGQNWKCIRTTVEDTDRGECDLNARVISIDQNLDPEDFLNALHHELWEGASYLTGCTYNRSYPDSQDMFIMTHSQMDLISGSVCGTYDEIKERMLGTKKNPTRKRSRK